VSVRWRRADDPRRPRSGTDRIAEATAISLAGGRHVQGDEPLIEPETIDAAIAPLLADSSVEMSTLSRPFQSLEEFKSPHVVKVVINLEGDALYFSRAPIPASGPSVLAALPAAARAHVGLYVYRRDTLFKLAALPAAPLELEESLEQLRALAHGIRIRVVDTRHVAAGVDTPEDLERVRSMMLTLSRT
jgi:3-deoxy-manno-octulosonate cytidylyltransferase (CMP-KDO synthetase)